MVRLSAAVMAHPVRRQYVEELLPKLGDVPVAWDQVPTPSTDTEQRWAVGRAAWAAHDPYADWHVVVQDDALVSDRFLEGLAEALAHVPFGVIVSGYCGTMRPNQRMVQTAIGRAEKHGSSWVTMQALNWGVAWAAPVVTIPDMLAWCDGQVGLTYDTRTGRYYRDVLGWGCWYTWPSLVDHRQGPSIAGHEPSGRFAHRFAPDATVPEWSRLPPDESVDVRAFRNLQSGRLLVIRDDVTASQMARARRWVEVDVETLPLASQPLR